jgi:tetratricopeptide (TPR) repeat protein
MLVVSSLALSLLLATLLVSNWRIGQEKTRAEAHFQLAREAVDEYITKVSQEPRLRAQDLDDFRKELLQSAVVFYEKLVQHGGGDPKAEAERGRAYERLGFITQEIANQSESLALYQRARAIFEDLIRTYPTVPDYQQELATTHNDMGNLYSAAGKLRDAEAAYDKALEIRERLANEHPSPSTQKAVAVSRNNLTNVYRATGRLQQAETALAAAVAIQEKLVRENPGVLEYE